MTSEPEIAPAPPPASEIAPDIETASADYASRFAGDAGRFLLDVQARSIMDAVDGHLGDSVLDVGGGHGQLRLLYIEGRAEFTIHGSDARCFARLPEPATGEARVVGPLRQLPFSSRQFGTVVSVRLLCHVPDWQSVLVEMCRVARERVVFDFPTSRSINGLTPLLFGVKKQIETNTRTYENFTLDAFDAVLEQCGFRVTSIQKQFFFPMVVHRVLRGSVISKWIEAVASVLGLRRAFGSPVVLTAHRSQGADHDA